MRSFLNFALLISVAVFIAGCSGMGVYESETTCPKSYNGRCISVPDAYDLAKRGKDGPDFDPAVQEAKKKSDSSEKDLSPKPSTEEDAHASYKESLYKRFDNLLKEPVTPVVAPPQVMRVLLLPYKSDGNELYMLRHVYFFVDEPRWLLGDSLVAMEED